MPLRDRTRRSLRDIFVSVVYVLATAAGLTALFCGLCIPPLDQIHGAYDPSGLVPELLLRRRSSDISRMTLAPLISLLTIAWINTAYRSRAFACIASSRSDGGGVVVTIQNRTNWASASAR